LGRRFPKSQRRGEWPRTDREKGGLGGNEQVIIRNKSREKKNQPESGGLGRKVLVQPKRKNRNPRSEGPKAKPKRGGTTENKNRGGKKGRGKDETGKRCCRDRGGLYAFNPVPKRTECNVEAPALAGRKKNVLYEGGVGGERGGRKTLEHKKTFGKRGKHVGNNKKLVGKGHA